LTLPFLGSIDLSYSPFQVINNGSSAGSGAIYGASMSATASAVTGMAAGTGVSGQGVIGVSGIGNAAHTTGVYGRTGGDAASGEGGWAGVWGDSHDSTAVQGTSFNDRGVLGITNSALAEAGVEGLSRAASGVGILGRTGSGAGDSSPAIGVGVWGDAPGVGVYATGGTGVRAQTHSSGLTALDATNAGGGDIAWFFGGTGGVFRVAKIDNSGKGFFDGGTQTGGADVAEFFTATSPLEPGDVVEIDVDHPGAFRRSSVANDTAVAGVVSTDPGVSMNARGGANATVTGPRLALAGRVPVKVTSEGGPIRPGDLLVASPTPGRAMKAPMAPLPGTIIGKALGSLPEGDGVVEMLVMLR
jgi:hypothetical protein